MITGQHGCTMQVLIIAHVNYKQSNLYFAILRDSTHIYSTCQDLRQKERKPEPGPFYAIWARRQGSQNPLTQQGYNVGVWEIQTKTRVAVETATDLLRMLDNVSQAATSFLKLRRSLQLGMRHQLPTSFAAHKTPWKWTFFLFLYFSSFFSPTILLCIKLSFHIGPPLRFNRHSTHSHLGLYKNPASL